MDKLFRYAGFFLLVAVSIGLWWNPLKSSLSLASHSSEHTHILLVLPLTFAFIYLRRKTLPAKFVASTGTAAVFLLVALAIAGATRSRSYEWTEDIRLSLNMLALVAWWLGSVVLCFGTRVLGALLFPLGLLLWLIPIPQPALDSIIHFLQHQSALAARILFQAFGVPVTQDGIMLSIPEVDLEVARECSSIRSSLILIITAMVLASLFLRSRWRKILLVAAAVPLSVAKNGLRIFVIAELGTRVDPTFFDGWLHHRGGIVFFATAVLALVGLLWILQRNENVPAVSECTARLADN